MVPCSSSSLVVGCLGRHLLAGLGGQLGHVQVDLGQSAGQVDLQRLTRRRDLGLDVTQVEQHARHLVGGVGGHAGFLDRTDDGVVVAHQPGALGPADQRVRQRNPLRPRRLGLPPRDHRVERGLRLAVGAVTAEHAAVRRAGQHHVQPRGDVALRADVRQAADQPLHGPQQHLHLHLGARPGVGQIAGHPRRREREQQRRRLGVLEVNRLRPKAFGLLATHPGNQRVDVGVGRHVGGHHPQLGAEPGVVAIQRAVERQPVVVELGRGRDDGRAAVEQLGHHRRGDGTLGRAGDHRDLVDVATLAGVLRTGRGAAVQRGVDVASRRQRLALPPGGLGADDVPGALEPLRQARPVGVDLALVEQPQLGQVLAGAGPAVVEQHRLAAVEHRSHQTRPVRTEFGRDQVDELGVGRRPAR